MAWYLVLTTGSGGDGDRVRLHESWTVTLGKDAANLVTLDAPSVSGTHCMLRFKEGAWHVTDLDSTNGTAVNGVPVSEAALSPGDVLTLGEVSLRLEASGGGPASAGVAAVPAAAPVPEPLAASRCGARAVAGAWSTAVARVRKIRWRKPRKDEVGVGVLGLFGVVGAIIGFSILLDPFVKKMPAGHGARMPASSGGVEQAARPAAKAQPAARAPARPQPEPAPRARPVASSRDQPAAAGARNRATPGRYGGTAGGRRPADAAVSRQGGGRSAAGAVTLEVVRSGRGSIRLVDGRLDIALSQPYVWDFALSDATVIRDGTIDCEFEHQGAKIGFVFRRSPDDGGCYELILQHGESSGGHRDEPLAILQQAVLVQGRNGREVVRKDVRELARAPYTAARDVRHSLRIDMRGRRIDVELNGVRLVAAEDPADGPASGGVGFSASTGCFKPSRATIYAYRVTEGPHAGR